MTPPPPFPSPQEWWTRVEAAVAASGDAVGSAETAADTPAWIAALGKAHAAEVSLRPDDATKALAGADDVPDGAWRRIHRLLALRADIRRFETLRRDDALASLVALIGEIPAEEKATSARAWHLLAIVYQRRDDFARAEEALTRALEQIEEGPARTWVLDGFGQVFLAQGAWEEGRKVLRAVARRKAAAGDVVGLAVTAGHWARMELGRGRAAVAEEVLLTALGNEAQRLPPLSRLRLESMLAEAVLDARGAEAAAPVVQSLVATLQAVSAQRHYLLAFAHLALARVAAAAGHTSASREHVAEASRSAVAPELVAHVRTVAASLDPSALDDPAWWTETAALLARVGVPTEAEVHARLLLAERAAGHEDRAVARGHLDAAFDLAARANHPGWAARVDEAYERIDLEGASRRRVERWTGATAREVEETRVEEATVVFADLVGFTIRSQELPPEETLSTARSLFELSMPPMVAHRVRPVSYLGDGLLAVVEGEGHARRALDFACQFVRKGARATLVRRAIGEPWGLELRAGVASGPVALGPLGTHVKMEYAVVGRTVNLAARLQGQAEPGEVVFADVAGTESFARGAPERLSLKGFPEPVAVRRIRPGA
jgi:class 3 adenylate cyclase